jgi:hypothetical protein
MLERTKPFVKKVQLTDLKSLVVERVNMCHRWLKSRTAISLDGFTDKVMESLVDADSRGSVRREREGGGSKGTGLSLPMFNGVLSQSQGMEPEMACRPW